MRTLAHGFIILAGLVVSAALHAQPPRLPAIFGDHMVLQGEQPLPVWGWAEPGERVAVTFAGQSGQTVADEDGAWMLRLEPIPHGGPHELVVETAGGSCRFTDVLVGEVWVCSGQSNMAYALRRASDGPADAAVDQPQIRLFTVTKETALEPLDSLGGAWEVASPQTLPDFSAVGYYFGRKLHAELGVAVGLIDNSWSGSIIESWMSRGRLESIPEARPILQRHAELEAQYPALHAAWVKSMEEWERSPAEGRPEAPEKPRGPDFFFSPAVLYNAMVAPLIPYRIRGVIWYQGEGNAGRAQQYRTLFPALIADWRSHWNQGDFPFLFVQLPAFNKPSAQPTDASWAHLREAQRHTLETVENTGMAIAIDLGEADDIHPPHKLDVGERLARWALADTYGRDTLVKSGPLLSGIQRQGNRAVLTFDSVGDTLAARGDGPLRGFSAAAPGGEFAWADARIIAPDRVEVSLPDGSPVVDVRYAWAFNPATANLINSAGLPASPFRTDTRPGPTDGKR